MYKKQTSMSLKGTPSMLANNMATCKAKYLSYAVVHKTVVCLNTVVAAGSSPVQKQIACKGEGTTGNCTVMQVKWCRVADRVVLVIASAKGVQMFEQDGSIMIFWHSVSQTEENKSFSYFTRGICSTLNRFLCVGTCTGSTLVFDIPAEGTGVKLHKTLAHHNVAITDLASIMDKMVSADEDGNIAIWQCDEKTRRIAEIRGSGTPCTSLALWNGFIAAAYSCGHIRIFDLTLGLLKVDICAHSRSVNSLDVAAETGMLLSVGEDSFARVWALPKDSSNKVDVLFQAPISNIQLCGGRFLDESGQSFGVSGYDLAEVVVFCKK